MYVFASDVHLSDPLSRRYKSFKAWLLSVKKDPDISKVFLMGDVFDLWLGDRDYFVSKHRGVIDLIFEIAQLKEVHIFEGNHDFQMGDFWVKNKVHVHKSFYEFSDENGKWLLTHGDLLDPSDKKYLCLRWFFRSLFCRLLIKFLPGFLLAKIGSSINTTDKKKPMTELIKFEKKWLNLTKALRQNRDFDFFICGHYHYRVDLKSSDYRAINLGSWLGDDLKVLEHLKSDFKFKDVGE